MFIFFLSFENIISYYFLIGKTADGTEASGKILIPEVAHDTEEDEYVVILIDIHIDEILILYMHLYVDVLIREWITKIYLLLFIIV